MPVRDTARRQAQRKALVLIAVLVVIVILSLAAYKYADLMMSEYEAADSVVKAAQARALAESGVNYVAALLSDPMTVQETLGGNIFDNPEYFQDQPGRLDETSGNPGRFSIVAPALQGGGLRYGVADESSKINLNAVMRLDPTGDTLYEMLCKLPNMPPDAAAAIVDWLDADQEPRQGGAENSEYAGQNPPYRCKNGPLDSVEELLLVRGITPDLLFGADRNRNGALDADEPGSGDPFMDLGWSAFLTVHSREQNITSDFQARIHLNEKDLEALHKRVSDSVGPGMADYIALYRRYGGRTVSDSSSGSFSSSSIPEGALDLTKGGRRKIKSLFDLVASEVRISSKSSKSGRGGRGGRGGSSQSTTIPSPLNSPDLAAGLLPVLFDRTTTSEDAELPSRININTAPEPVLRALPDLTEEDVTALLTARPPLGAQGNDGVSWLFAEGAVKPSVLKKLERFVTTRSQVYRFQVIGYFENGGPTARVEAVVDTNAGRPRIIYRRDLSVLGKGTVGSGQ